MEELRAPCLSYPVLMHSSDGKDAMRSKNDYANIWIQLICLTSAFNCE
uniref:Uncharacterized protein n=1 Tax=Rhizophora mucronata TaxID=61149 RepID=A0A2P2KYD0_RHIMU